MADPKVSDSPRPVNSGASPIQVACQDCSIHYKMLGNDLVLPDQQWNAICPEGGILCANCICKRAKTHGGTAVLAWINNLDYAISESAGER